MQSKILEYQQKIYIIEIKIQCAKRTKWSENSCLMNIMFSLVKPQYVTVGRACRGKNSRNRPNFCTTVATCTEYNMFKDQKCLRFVRLPKFLPQQARPIFGMLNTPSSMFRVCIRIDLRKKTGSFLIVLCQNLRKERTKKLSGSNQHIHGSNIFIKKKISGMLV